MITDDMMRERLARTKPYCAVILLRIVCPVSDGSSVCGIGIFEATLDRRAQAPISRWNGETGA